MSDITETANNMLAMIGGFPGVEDPGLCGCGECPRCLLDCAGESIRELLAENARLEARCGELVAALNDISMCRIPGVPDGATVSHDQFVCFARDHAKRALSGTGSRVADCDHEWVDARNKIIQDGEWCPKCNAIRAGNEVTDALDAGEG